MAARKHAEFIKAWADGAQIQTMTAFGWRDIGDSPSWLDRNEYRIKPSEPEKVYPVTKMTADQLFEYFISSSGGDNSQACVVVANKALQHACDNGQIVTREEFDRAITDRKARDMVVAKHVHDKIFALLNTPDAQCKPIASFVSSLSIEKLVAEVK